jgi:sugar lactone lactonase YvrE
MNAVQRYSIGTFNNPRGIAVDNSSGFIYVAAYNNNVVVRIPPDGGTSTFATLSFPLGVAVDSAGNVYVSAAGRIYKITPAGGVTTFAGDGTDGFADGTGTNARFSSANGLAFDSSGNLYVADQLNNRIRKITPAGVVTTLAGGFPVFNYPTGVAVDSLGNVYVADSETHRIKKVTPAGVVTLVAGINQGYQDGSALGLPNALFNLPTGVAVDSSGNLLVADNRNHRIRKITPDGVVTTFAGNGTQIRGYDSEIGTNASFNNPYAIALNSSGQMFITDGSTSTQGVVRKIS